MPTWFRRGDGKMDVKDDKDENLDDVEFKPEKLKEDITKDFDTKLTAFATKQEATMKPLLDMAASIAQDKKDREEAARKASEKKEKDDNAITSEDMLLDPLNATRRLIQEGTSGVARATMMLAARGNIRETLENKPYYHGDLKSKVDAMVANQPLEMQCRADVVENCYKTVVFDHMEDIKEGKIKTKTSAFTFEQGGTGGPSGSDKTESTETMSEDEVRAAAAMGIKKDDWIKSRKELTYV